MALTLRQWREKEGLSQTEAGQLIGVSYVNISRWENDPVPSISGKNIIKILNVTQGVVTPNSLFGVSEYIRDESLTVEYNSKGRNSTWKRSVQPNS